MIPRAPSGGGGEIPNPDSAGIIWAFGFGDDDDLPACAGDGCWCRAESAGIAGVWRQVRTLAQREGPTLGCREATHAVLEDDPRSRILSNADRYETI